jgi:hypothetical protein
MDIRLILTIPRALPSRVFPTLTYIESGCRASINDSESQNWRLSELSFSGMGQTTATTVADTAVKRIAIEPLHFAHIREALDS